MPRLAVSALVVALAVASSAAAEQRAVAIQMDVFVHTSLPLGDVVWTGTQFLYATETDGTIAASDAAGGGLHTFATLPKKVEEVRCELSPGAHGWPAGAVFCHWPGERIYRIDADGTVTAFADLPVKNADVERSDGAMTFDRSGRFGYALLAANGHSSANAGGTVFAVASDGSVRRVGHYPGPGGAENLAMASSRFGRASGDVLISVDHDGAEGMLVAMTPQGRALVVARRLGNGINPLVVVGAMHASGTARAGLYVTDTTSTNVFFAAASQFRTYAGAAIVGVEKTGAWFAVVAKGRGFRVIKLATSLPKGKYNLEGAKWVGS